MPALELNYIVLKNKIPVKGYMIVNHKLYMKTWLLILIIFPIMLQAQSISDLDYKNGYKDLSFSLPADSSIKVSKAKKSWFGGSDKHQLYVTNNEKYTSFADFKCNVWLFKDKKDGQLASITLLIPGDPVSTFSKLRVFFEGLYGDPTKADTVRNELEWGGLKVRLVLKYSSVSGITCTINNREYELQEEEAIRQRLQEKKNEF